MDRREIDQWHIRRALELAQHGLGRVEPNPMVGCVIASGAEIIGEGWHGCFGGPHAEVEALRLAGDRAAGATMYVTLEPCSHYGKTPPCVDAVIDARLARVVVPREDPFGEVAGRGLAALRAAGIEVEVGLFEREALALTAPYDKLLRTGLPWVMAKWAMTLDGKTATRTGSSRWISGEKSREIVHRLRGRVDAVLVGSGTATHDDPLLTARPPGPRTALRVVADTHGSLASTSRLVQTARESPVLVAVGTEASEREVERLRRAGCEVYVTPGDSRAERQHALLVELGRRRLTNVLVEGGWRLLGALFDAHAIDEVHVFIAPKLIGGADAPGAIAGLGLARMQTAATLGQLHWEEVDGDLYCRGVIR